MSYFNKRKSSGVFTPSGEGFVEYKGDIGNGSINSIRMALGYSVDQLHSEMFSEYIKPKIYAVTFEVFTRNIAFVVTDSNVTYLTMKDVTKYIKWFSAAKEFTTLRTHDILSDGVENGSLSSEFLSRVLKLQNVSSNGMFYSERIQTYLHFTEGILTNFQVDDGYMPYARHIKEVNETIFNWMSELAFKYWPNDDFNAKKEINIQCEAWSAIPDAFGNEYIDLHRTENGGANLHMIRVCHYGHPIDLKQFVEVNNGRFIRETDDVSIGSVIIINMGKFRYYFDSTTEELMSFEQII